MIREETMIVSTGYAVCCFRWHCPVSLDFVDFDGVMIGNQCGDS